MVVDLFSLVFDAKSIFFGFANELNGLVLEPKTGFCNNGDEDPNTGLESFEIGGDATPKVEGDPNVGTVDPNVEVVDPKVGAADPNVGAVDPNEFELFVVLDPNEEVLDAFPNENVDFFSDPNGTGVGFNENVGVLVDTELSKPSFEDKSLFGVSSFGG